MKVPVERTPPRRFALGERVFERIQHFDGAVELLVGHEGNGAAEQIAFDVGAQLEQLVDLVERERGDDGAAVRAEADEALGLELAQGFADGDAAHSEFVGEGVLAKGLAVGEVAAENSLAEGFDSHAGDGLSPNRGRHARGRWRVAVRGINVRYSPKGHANSNATKVGADTISPRTGRRKRMNEGLRDAQPSLHRESHGANRLCPSPRPRRRIDDGA